MAEDSQDKSQKTEDPTQKRLEDARKKGQVINSREVTSFFMLLVLTLLLGLLIPLAMEMTYKDFSRFIINPHAYATDEGALRQLFTEIFYDGLVIMAMIISGTWIAALGGNMVQRQLTFSFEPLKPKLEKISVLKGLKRMFSLRSIVEFAKGLLKISIVAGIAMYAVWPYLGFLKQLPGYELIEFIKLVDYVAVKLMIGVCIAMAFIAGFDYAYQRYEYIKNLRMSRQDIKDEFKEQEGDPHVKAKIKSIRMERAQKRMMSNVPDADVVITNPTHFAIALKYDPMSMGAPQVVAKGQDNIALKIREIAEENDVPVVENPPLARAMFDQVEVDQEIPLEYYQAVAEIISYVYQLQGKTSTRPT